MTTRVGSDNAVKPESVGSIEAAAASALGNSRGVVTTAEPDLVYQRQPSDPRERNGSGIVGVNMSATQPTPAVPPRPQLKLMNPDRPVRYIPIHVWYALCACETGGQAIQCFTF